MHSHFLQRQILIRWGMTFESLVLLTMAEEHLANSRPGSSASGSMHSLAELQMADWKPLKVKFPDNLPWPLIGQSNPKYWPLIG